jgi:hypothetical protein
MTETNPKPADVVVPFSRLRSKLQGAGEKPSEDLPPRAIQPNGPGGGMHSSGSGAVKGGEAQKPGQSNDKSEKT